MAPGTFVPGGPSAVDELQHLGGLLAPERLAAACLDLLF